MSSIINQPFGNNRPSKSRRSTGNQSVFHLKIEGDQIEGFIEFLELVYQSRIQVKQNNGTDMFFKCKPHRTSAGIRFALTLYDVTLITMQDW